MGARWFRFGDGSGGVSREGAEELVQLVSTSQNKLPKHPADLWGSETCFNLTRGNIIVLNKNWYRKAKLIVTMNSQIMGMIVLVGVRAATTSWTLWPVRQRYAGRSFIWTRYELKWTYTMAQSNQTPVGSSALSKRIQPVFKTWLLLKS